MKFKKLMCIAITMLPTTNVFATEYGYNVYNYGFENSYGDNQFGNSTTSNIVVDYTDSQNVRRNKDTSYLPTSYGYFSGLYESKLGLNLYQKAVNIIGENM